MSREVYRVPLDFDAPVGKIWQGYLMPEELHSIPCKVCDETGLSNVAKLLRDQWYGYAPFKPEQRGSTPLTPSHPRVRAFAERNVGRSPEFYGNGEAAIVRESERLCQLWNAQWSHHLNQEDVNSLVAEGRLIDLTHRWEGPPNGWVPTGHHPNAQEVNDWSIGGFGHDSINQYIVVDAECDRLGVDKRCSVCDGEGATYRDDAHAAAHEAWERTQPPTGEAWQMWETTSEGSPISPVFDSPEELARWLADTGASAFGGSTATYDQWLNMIGVEVSAASCIMTDRGLISGVAAVSQ